jgi:hypothetical protein
MMSFLSPSHKTVRFESVRWNASTTVAGVRFAVREPSLTNRIELTRQLHELTLRNEFLASGKEMEQLELALAELLVQKLLVEWGLAAIEGLEIDGEPATPALVIQSGPEKLVAEIAAAVKSQCGLSDDERKTDRRIPVPVFESSRMELRRLPEARLDHHPELRVLEWTRSTRR